MRLPDPAHASYLRLAVAARGFFALIVAVPILILGQANSVLALVAILGIWLAATVADVFRLRWAGTVFAVEAALVGVVVGLTVADGLVVAPAIAVTPFTAGLRVGVRGMLVGVSFEVAALVAVSSTQAGSMSPEQVSLVLTWAMIGLGVGFIASYLRLQAEHLAPDPLGPYREAQVLIRELLDLSGDLRSGLDPVSLASRIAIEVRNQLPLIAVAVYLPRSGALTPLVTSASAITVDTDALAEIADESWHARKVVITDQAFAMPLRNDRETVAVVSGLLPGRVPAGVIGAKERLDALSDAMVPSVVQLDTALLFSRLRDAATTEERRRLAREMHDGVAQDIASLGYLVDALSAAPATPAQAEGLRRLRERITAVVSQVRMSVQTLRHEVEDAESLGAAIGGLARHLGESSGTPIRVTVNETTTRLRPEVEAELMRIAQESMNNAVRHAHATGIDVSIRVAAPAAEIVVRDDGRGLGGGRADSYGLAIMQERAQLIDADLLIEPAEPHGTVVTVRVPSKHRSSPRTPPTPTEKVTA